MFGIIRRQRRNDDNHLVNKCVPTMRRQTEAIAIEILLLE
jgi:hypothetical protein